MGLFNSVFGGGKKKTGSTETVVQKEATDKTQIQKVDQSGTTTTLSAGAMADIGSALALNTRDQKAHGGMTTQEKSLNDIGTELKVRAEGAAAALTKETGAILDQARLSGTRELQRLTTDLAAATGGSTANSFVVGATGEAAVSLESQLADLGAKLAIQIHGIQGADFEQAIAALQQSSAAGAAGDQSIAYLADALKGGKTTTKAATRVTDAESIRAVLRKESVGTGTTNDTTGILGNIGQSLSSFGQGLRLGKS